MKLLLVLATIIFTLGVVASSVVIPYSYPLYKQCDSRWGSNEIINQTVCNVGCLMSSCSMAIAGKGITLDGNLSNPGSLNEWLRNNEGYVGDDLLEESVLENISNGIQWVGSYPASAFTMDEVVDMINKQVVVIINVLQGAHFVLAVGYDQTNTVFYVNDPGFNTLTYTYEDVVGYRIFNMI
ncbi:hypothetical protein DICPUDRAFT_29096 [Dictyostelium purpureum]|uniref:Peptidase C39-like domain-containing protein n=1 Tax=Dictyostelium purpureum TaxID=5786 RepID=F0ZCX3_DICPU|nr:uncharacterized protein DICPUDRAFT_29096 [Dictyostelium purpureum]EGC38213.1 hypothetical protein DICPUDRAFT_29096 [Dictyostelium purpureum]|eukprot:XP_003285251.1 hypothetical protein DICPUDRAFT_29096 [Dictyostelium purpureum]